MEHRLSPVVIVPTRQNTAFVERDLRVEVSVVKGLQNLSLTGLPNEVLRDARDKIRALLHNSLPWDPLERLVVHLAPQELPKTSAHLELPILLACWVALQPELRADAKVLKRLQEHRFYGCVDLSGRLSTTSASESLETGSAIDIGASRFESFERLCAWLVSQDPPPALLPSAPKPSAPHPPAPLHVEGRLVERFALLVAAVIKEPVLLVGPPGVGKSHLGRWCRDWYRDDAESVSKEKDRIWRSAGHAETPRPPFVNPHARTHVSEFLGYKRSGRSLPGLFSMAHGGLMVLDEFPELARDVREIFRNVLDQKQLRRFNGQDFVSWPADFWLVATANPCACGQARPRDLGRCRCTRGQLGKYLDRFSGPLLDRFGLQLFLHETSDAKMKARLESKEMGAIRAVLEGRNETRADFVAGARARLALQEPKTSASRKGVQRQRLLSALEACEVPTEFHDEFLAFFCKPFLDEKSFR
jgi:magnesium chelatase family protein